MKVVSTKIILRTGFIIGVVLLVLTLSSLRTEATGTTFACEGLDLKVDSRTTYNGRLMPKLSWSLKDLVPGVDRFFKFSDIKPGDMGTTTISLHLKRSSAWMCLDFTNLKDKENGINEPESLEDTTRGTGKGELSRGVEFFAWFDDGDNRFEPGEKPVFGTVVQDAFSVMNGRTYALADSKNGPAWKTNKTRYIGITWCAGNLTVDVANAKIACDGETLGNEVQTDSFSVNIALRAVPAQDNPRFLCNKEEDDDDDHGHYTWHEKKDNRWWHRWWN